jgi:hypothetical protein
MDDEKVQLVMDGLLEKNHVYLLFSNNGLLFLAFIKSGFINAGTVIGGLIAGGPGFITGGMIWGQEPGYVFPQLKTGKDPHDVFKEYSTIFTLPYSKIKKINRIIQIEKAWPKLEIRKTSITIEPTEGEKIVISGIGQYWTDLDPVLHYSLFKIHGYEEYAKTAPLNYERKLQEILKDKLKDEIIHLN